MRLINTKTLELEEFFNPPEYAILSHRWEADEVSFEEYTISAGAKKSAIERKAGYSKIISCCSFAKARGQDWVWIDTCCIDKRSSAELSEAINSIWSWYENAKECYVYLSDVSLPSSQDFPQPEEFDEVLIQRFRNSAWFTRGWTLQELLAPQNVVVFCARSWEYFYKLVKYEHMEYREGSSINRAHDQRFITAMEDITGIREINLRDPSTIRLVCIARRMSWAAKRQTTRVEDLAYCLLGLFNINMPLLYGEGPKAFYRLQQEIIRQSDDESIFAWKWRTIYPPFDALPLLAPSPSVFHDSDAIMYAINHNERSPRSAYSITNKGLQMETEVWVVRDTKYRYPWMSTFEGKLYIIRLHCSLLPWTKDPRPWTDCALVLRRIYWTGKDPSTPEGPNDIYHRVNFEDLGEDIDSSFPPDQRETLGVIRLYIRLTGYSAIGRMLGNTP